MHTQREENEVTCIVDGCEKPRRQRYRRCGMHLHRLWRHGDTDTVLLGNRAFRDVITYAAAHKRVVRKRGKASDHNCVDCGERAAQWSYDHTDPNEMTQERQGCLLPYSGDVERYAPRCASCHVTHDYAVKRTG